MAQPSDSAFVNYFRCPTVFDRLCVRLSPSPRSGFFRFNDNVLYGPCCGTVHDRLDNGSLWDAAISTEIADCRIRLTFDPTEVIENLRREEYPHGRSVFRHSILQRGYYSLRTLLPDIVRGALQRRLYSGWERKLFPHWPVDTTVENLFEDLMTLLLQYGETDRVPFIWFWPDGFPGAAIVTHDVETAEGLRHCIDFMNIDESYGIPSSFQVVPVGRYRDYVPLIDQLAAHGFETNVHDLSHDGLLCIDSDTFFGRAEQINRHVEAFHCAGFRSGMMYRNLNWFRALNISYDMSVPNVAHLEPQQGGCCSVMPYFFGDKLELPLTTTQDYALFRILGDYSPALWKTQTEIILRKHGLASFIVHPDYSHARRERDIYFALLDHLIGLRHDKRVWIAAPQAIDQWWRARNAMTLVRDGDFWSIEGVGSEHARVAYAYLRSGKLVYEIESNKNMHSIGTSSTLAPFPNFGTIQQRPE